MEAQGEREGREGMRSEEFNAPQIRFMFMFQNVQQVVRKESRDA